MPEGQFSGVRKTYNYISDSGSVIALSLDATLGDLSENGLSEANNDNLGNNKPLRFKPRGVYWQGTLNNATKRKFIICAANATIYRADRSQALTIDGVAGKTTGRRGEVLTYPSVTSDATESDASL